MKVDLSTTIDLPAEAVWAEVQTAPLLMHIAWPLMRFVPVGKEPLNAFKDGGRYPMKLRLFSFQMLGTNQQFLRGTTYFDSRENVWLN